MRILKLLQIKAQDVRNAAVGANEDTTWLRNPGRILPQNMWISVVREEISQTGKESLTLRVVSKLVTSLNSAPAIQAWEQMFWWNSRACATIMGCYGIGVVVFRDGATRSSFVNKRQKREYRYAGESTLKNWHHLMHFDYCQCRWRVLTEKLEASLMSRLQFDWRPYERLSNYDSDWLITIRITGSYAGRWHVEVISATGWYHRGPCR